MPAHCELDVRFFRPPPEFDGCFTTFYRLEVKVRDGERVEDWLQPEWANVRFFKGDCPTAQVPGGDGLSGARMTSSGPSSLPTHFLLGQTRAWGVGLFPLGWAKFANAHASVMANALVDGETSPAFSKLAPVARAIFADEPDDEAEYQRLLELFGSLNHDHPDEYRIRAVHAALVDESVGSVAEFASHAAVSPRTLERLCQRYFGFPPKLLLRRQRFMRSLAEFMLGPARNWTDALDDQYHDQAQFTREFRSFMVMSPSEYAKLEHPILRAFMQERARIWGSPAQTLDKPR